MTSKSTKAHGMIGIATDTLERMDDRSYPRPFTGNRIWEFALENGLLDGADESELGAS